jgi:hypothetical protein
MVECANYEVCHHYGVHRCPGCGRHFCDECYELFLDVLPFGAAGGKYPKLPAPLCPQCHYVRFRSVEQEQEQ